MIKKKPVKQTPKPVAPPTMSKPILKKPEQQPAYVPGTPGVTGYDERGQPINVANKEITQTGDLGNKNTMVSIGMAGKNWDFNPAEYRAIMTNVGVMTPNVLDYKNTERNLRLYGTTMAPPVATEEALSGAVSNEPNLTPPTAEEFIEQNSLIPLDTDTVAERLAKATANFKVGFESTLYSGNVNTGLTGADILNGFGTAIEVMRTGVTGKDPSSMTKAMDSFSNAKTSMQAQIEMVKAGQIRYTDAAESLMMMELSINQLERRNKYVGKLNLNHWRDQGLNIDTQIRSEKNQMKEMRQELILAYNQVNQMKEAGYAQQYGGY